MNNFTVADFQRAIKEVSRVYGSAIARNVERIYRLETRHFDSLGYRATGSPGMEASSGKLSYPYGWSKGNVWPKYKPSGIWYYRENGTGITKPFLQFPNVTAAAMTIADFLRRHDNNPGRWYSTDKAKQLAYTSKIMQNNPVFV